MSRMDRGLVEHFDEPARNRCLSGFCAYLESNKCMANAWNMSARNADYLLENLSPEDHEKIVD